MKQIKNCKEKCPSREVSHGSRHNLIEKVIHSFKKRFLFISFSKLASTEAPTQQIPTLHPLNVRRRQQVKAFASEVLCFGQNQPIKGILHLNTAAPTQG